MPDPRCDNCKVRFATVEGWFYTQARLNPWAQGTADAGLLQLRQVCGLCCQNLINAGLHPTSKKPAHA